MSRRDRYHAFRFSQQQRFYWSLDGTTELLRSETKTLGIANQWSLGFHWQPQNAGAFFTTIFNAKQSSGANNRMRFYQDASTGEFNFTFYDSAAAIFKNGTLSGVNISGVTSYLVFTFDGDAVGDPLLIYKNGIPISPTFSLDTTGTMTDTARSIYIGGLTYYTRMLFQDFFLHNGVLTPAEVATLYAQVRDSDPFAGLNLLHAHTPSDIDDMGKDYGISGSPLDLMAFSVDIDSSDRFPGVLI